MRRRTFLGEAALAAGTAAMGRWPLLAGQQSPNSNDSKVKRVLVTFLCHLDVGFTDTQANVMKLYFDHYFPEAMRTAAMRRAAGKDRYVWTTGSWLVHTYLEQANTDQRRHMEQAITAGDIAWHALPFNWQTEMLDRSMIEGCLGFSASLDRRFGRKTTGAKMSDVPGHSRGIIPPLAAHGVQLLDIGVNSASTPPDVPDVFLWKNPDGSSLAMLYHRHGYGSVLRIPQSDLAIAVEVRNDNSGPHSQEEIQSIYARLRQQFPSASVTAANFSDVASAVHGVHDKLPVVTAEIGDTWIYGAPSDPPKVARYREASRLRKEWIARKQFATGDATDRRLLTWLALAAEHTWGTDTKRYIDYDHYKPKDLAQVLDKPGYQTMERSWQEKRDDIDAGLATLPAALRQEAQGKLRALHAVQPSTQELHAYPAGKEFSTTHFVVALDPQTGAIIKLQDKKTRREWASSAHPLGLFTYQTLSKADYDAFLKRYVISQEWWAPRDFGKPNIQHFGAQSQEWHPKVQACWADKRNTRLLTELKIDDPESERSGRVAWPQSLWLELLLPEDEPVLHVALSSHGKVANRMPESMWLTFAPDAPETRNWVLEKVEQPVSPLHVVRGGNRSMHAVTSHARYHDGRGSFDLTTADAPVIAVGARSPLDFSEDLPRLENGLHVNLFNNAWGTNYPQWASGDWLFRFTVALNA